MGVPLSTASTDGPQRGHWRVSMSRRQTVSAGTPTVRVTDHLARGSRKRMGCGERRPAGGAAAGASESGSSFKACGYPG
jgi:hypothetical protein